MDTDFITTAHSLYHRYNSDWTLQFNSFVGGTEYKAGKYLRAYTSDVSSQSETINTYTTNPDGSVIGKVRTQLERADTRREAATGDDGVEDGTFYGEKLANVPLYNYVKLIVSEYNSILFRNPPQRVLPENDAFSDFINNVDGEGNNISEFQALLDQYVTIYGVCHVGVYLHSGKPKWCIHTPLEITNWRHTTDSYGNRVLSEVVIQLEETADYTLYRYMNSNEIITVWAGDEEYEPTDITDDMVQLAPGIWGISEVNELDYVPIVTTYQNVKVYNNIGSTIISDCSGIQRSIYGDLAEIYSAITYGAHPTLVVDETTDTLNDGEVGAEPGSMVRVQSSLDGEPNYVYEFVAPELNAITEIRDLIDNKIEKMTQIAMLRSEDLIRGTTSGEHVDAMDDKLAAQIRRKATNLENSEYNQWKITFDWLNLNMPEDFRISYSRQYNRKAVEREVGEISQLMDLITRYSEQNPDADVSEMQAQVSQRILELVNSTSTSNGV